MDDQKQKIDETLELSDMVKEMIKPENLMGPYKTTKELMDATWFAEEDD